MIEVKNLKKKFKETEVLKGVNLSFEKGDIVALIGPSGTGKSTLLRCLNLLEIPDEGSLHTDEYSFDLANCSKKDVRELHRRTAMVFQQFNLFQKKTALENVMEGLVVVKKMDKKKAEHFAYQQLKKVGLADKVYHYPKHLSGGQQQRVAIARALAMEPEILLLDEPTSALDPQLVGEVLETIKQVARDGNTMLLASHEMNFVKSVATKVIFLSGGNIVEAGTAEQIFEAPKEDKTREFLNIFHMLSNYDYSI